MNEKVKERWIDFKLKLLSVSFLSWLICTGLVTWFILRDLPERALGYVVAWLAFTEIMILGRKKLNKEK